MNKLPFWTRLKFAFKVFNLQPFELLLPFEEHSGRFANPQLECDNSWNGGGCESGKAARHALYQTVIKFSVDDGNLYAVCQDCKELSEGRIYKPHILD